MKTKTNTEQTTVPPAPKHRKYTPVADDRKQGIYARSGDANWYQTGTKTARVFCPCG